MQEIWKDIKGYEGLYQVSNLGRIKSLHYKKETILKPNIDKYGYLHIILYKNGESRTFTVHRIVALTFIPNPNNLPQVNHINGIKTDNQVFNLEFCDNSENQKHAYKTGLRKISDKQRSNGKVYGKLNGLKNGKKIIQYDLQENYIATWDSIAEAQRELKIKNICGVLKGRRKTSGGYIWRYL